MKYALNCVSRNSQKECFTVYPRLKIPQFHLISWCGNFVEKHSFQITKLSEIAVFYEVIAHNL